MSATTVYHIRFDCTDPSDTIISHDLWVENYDSITTCPLGISGHTLIDKVFLGKISQMAKTIIDDTSDTNGNYRAIGFDYNVNPGPDTDYQVLGDESYSYNVRVKAITINPGAENIGDTFSFVSARNTPVGALTADVSSGVILNVSDTVLVNINVGFEVTLQTGTTEQNLGECITIDSVAKTITVQNAVTSLFPAGSVVMITIKRIENLKITSDRLITFGGHNSNSTLAPAGLKGTVLYKNSTNVAKQFSVFAEISY